MDTVIKSIERQMENLVMYRGTKSDIEKRLSTIGQRLDVTLEPFEDEAIIKDNDFGFNVNLGKLNDHYLDFEIYMLPTNQKDVFIITEVNPF